MGVWCDIYSLSELQADFSTTLGAATLRRFLDSALELVFGYVGHAFGQAIWIYHDESAGATGATVGVSALGVLTLTIVGGVNAGSDTFTLSSYTLWTLAVAIDNLAKGWQVKVVSDPEQPAENLRVIAVMSVLGYANQRPLCLCSWTEIKSGGESHLFLAWPFRSVATVIEDSDTLVDGTDYWAVRNGWIIRRYTDGSQRVPYERDYWSMKEPNNISVNYVPYWIGPVPSIVMQVILGLVQFLIVAGGGYQSEKIGDYSYSKDGSTVLTWLQMLDTLGSAYIAVSGVGGGLV